MPESACPTVSEIHRYPLRPSGFEEPLFPTPHSRRAVMGHLASSPWLSKASDLPAAERGSSAEETARLERRGDGKTYLVRTARPNGAGCRTTARRVADVLEKWREVRGWWMEGGEVRFLYRLLLSDDSVVDVARERTSGGWALVGVVD